LPDCLKVHGIDTYAVIEPGASRIERDLGLRLASEEATRKLFPASGDAREVRDRLVDACRRRGVRIRYGASVKSLRTVADPSQKPSGCEGPLHTGSHDTQHQPSHSRSAAAAPAAFPANGAGSAAARRDSNDGPPRWVCGLRDGSEVDPSNRVLKLGAIQTLALQLPLCPFQSHGCLIPCGKC